MWKISLLNTFVKSSKKKWTIDWWINVYWLVTYGAMGSYARGSLQSWRFLYGFNKGFFSIKQSFDLVNITYASFISSGLTLMISFKTFIFGWKFSFFEAKSLLNLLISIVRDLFFSRIQLCSFFKNFTFSIFFSLYKVNISLSILTFSILSESLIAYIFKNLLFTF